MPRGRRSTTEVRDDAVPASKIVEEWEASAKTDVEDEDNSHLPPLPLPTVNEPRRTRPGSAEVQWSIEELNPPEEEPTEEPEGEGVSGEGPAPSVGTGAETETSTAEVAKARAKEE